MEPIGLAKVGIGERGDVRLQFAISPAKFAVVEPRHPIVVEVLDRIGDVHDPRNGARVSRSVSAGTRRLHNRLRSTGPRTICDLGGDSDVLSEVGVGGVVRVIDPARNPLMLARPDH